MEKIEELQKWIDESDNIVFFGGAGVSTESGIKDFRSKDGLYHMKYKYPPEMILSHTFFENNPKEFYIFYKDKMNCMDAKPNIIHNYLAKLEKNGKLKAIVTQNIDNLHTEAGNKNVFELHGNVMRNYCTKCHKFYDGEFVFKSKDLPLCSCGGLIKPDVVLYEEPLDEKTINGAIDAINKADVLIVAGTSLTVYPASSFVSYYRGNKMVIINRDPTDYDRVANLVINDSLKDVFEKLK
jgi:NAD-dependent deacetylase